MNAERPVKRRFATPSKMREMKKALLEFQFSIFRRIKEAYANEDEEELNKLGKELLIPVKILKNGEWRAYMNVVPVEAFKHDKNNDCIRLFPHKVWCLIDMVQNINIPWNDANNIASATEQAWAAGNQSPPDEKGEVYFTTASFKHAPDTYPSGRSRPREPGNTATAPGPVIDCALASLLCIDHSDISPDALPDLLYHRDHSPWIFHVTYHGIADDLNQHLTNQEFPRTVFVLGQLCIAGEGLEQSFYRNPDHWITPSWFVVVVDLERPGRPVWLARDLRILSWTTFDPYEESEEDEEDEEDRWHRPILSESERRFEPEDPYNSKIREEFAEDFFKRLAGNDTDLIKLFSSVSEWNHADLDAATLKRYLFDDNNRFQKTIPRLEHIVTEPLSSRDKNAPDLMKRLPC
ncbi:uncharacterized protein PV07_09233 [Cladophialophora immunda]|uniref:Uncharacterized protein n=1 Tax=Cladophialophora immunda TaxID=569365 RepID=A0A0D1ZEG8_9EURO|nr:uncharacterized protein PV07_09233 [Cladophialophora immunda]KIW26106.1 hypothetical protein PV07_09233 [Cladophialophora immunda]OQU95915.1 hypothetical protein CLAIMM_02071 isoform 1 [Cladophialophora immunda]OQU95916.1 hypothetical protein CLAIMM_02071 isoform 2 [Cladophialophora immunda]